MKEEQVRIDRVAKMSKKERRLVGSRDKGALSLIPLSTMRPSLGHLVF